MLKLQAVTDLEEAGDDGEGAERDDDEHRGARSTKKC